MQQVTCVEHPALEQKLPNVETVNIFEHFLKSKALSSQIVLTPCHADSKGW